MGERLGLSENQEHSMARHDELYTRRPIGTHSSVFLCWSFVLYLLLSVRGPVYSAYVPQEVTELRSVPPVGVSQPLYK